MMDYKDILDQFDFGGYESPASELKEFIEGTDDQHLKTLVQTELIA